MANEDFKNKYNKVNETNNALKAKDILSKVKEIKGQFESELKDTDSKWTQAPKAQEKVKDAFQKIAENYYPTIIDVLNKIIQANEYIGPEENKGTFKYIAKEITKYEGQLAKEEATTVSTKEDEETKAENIRNLDEEIENGYKALKATDDLIKGCCQ